jgi:hypothetical protein
LTLNRSILLHTYSTWFDEQEKLEKLSALAGQLQTRTNGTAVYFPLGEAPVQQGGNVEHEQGDSFARHGG